MTPYKMKPAGHKAPEEKREYARPDSKLQSVFEEWLERCKPYDYSNNFTLATNAINDLEATIEEAHGLIITFKNHPKIISAGLFLSAIYQQILEQQIVYDLDIPLDFVGYELPAGKTLINNGTTGGLMGWGASGPVINNGETGIDMGSYASGPVINNGTTEDYMGECASELVINNGTTGEDMGWRASGPVINNGETGDRMGHYASGPVINNGETGDCMGYEASGLFLTPTNPKDWAKTFKGTHISAEQIRANRQLDEYLTRICTTTRKLKTIDDVLAFQEEFDPTKLQDEIKVLIHTR